MLAWPPSFRLLFIHLSRTCSPSCPTGHSATRQAWSTPGSPPLLDCCLACPHPVFLPVPVQSSSLTTPHPALPLQHTLFPDLSPSTLSPDSPPPPRLPRRPPPSARLVYPLAQASHPPTISSSSLSLSTHCLYLTTLLLRCLRLRSFDSYSTASV